MIQNCSYCGAELEFAPDQELMVCEYCHHENRAKKEDAADVEKLLDAAEKRNAGCFEDAEKNYHELVIENAGNYQAIWGSLLCKYGVVYIERENEDRVLTCRIANDNSEFKSEMAYKQVCQLAPASEVEQFRKDADLISSIQRRIRQLKNTRYDIFICYKETENGYTTTDSDAAEFLYNELSTAGYRVFFAKKNLYNMAGADYEAEIFNAIEKCKVMLVMGSKAEYFSSTWVKSEWSRFLERIEKDSTKVLIPLKKNIDFYELPDEITKKRYQGIDFGEDSAKNYAQLKSRLQTIFAKQVPILYEADVEPDKAAREAILMIADGETEEGMKKLRNRARQKSLDARFLLATVLYEDQENQEKLKEAFFWFKEAADAGYADARFQTGFMYEFGIGTYPSREKAEFYYRGLDKERYPIPI